MIRFSLLSCLALVFVLGEKDCEAQLQFEMQGSGIAVSGEYGVSGGYFSFIFVDSKNGKVVEITPEKPNPPIKKHPKLEIKEPGEKWFRDKVLALKPRPKVFRTEGGKGMGDFVVVIDGTAVVIEIKRPTGKPVLIPVFSDNSGQIDIKNEGDHIKTETGATKVGGGFEVKIPLKPSDGDWHEIYKKIKEKAGVKEQVPDKEPVKTEGETGK